MATLTVKTKFSVMKFECEQYNYKKGGSFGTLVTYDKEGRQLEVVTIGNALGGDNPQFQFEG